MTRARAAALTVLGAVLAVLGLATPTSAGSEQVPPSTTLVAVPSTVPASTPAATPTIVVAAAPASTVPRAASGFVDVRKPAAESWELRQVLIILGLGIVALAALGYAYGRIRSVGPRHPGLVRSVE